MVSVSECGWVCCDGDCVVTTVKAMEQRESQLIKIIDESI